MFSAGMMLINGKVDSGQACLLNGDILKSGFCFTYRILKCLDQFKIVIRNNDPKAFLYLG